MTFSRSSSKLLWTIKLKDPEMNVKSNEKFRCWNLGPFLPRNIIAKTSSSQIISLVWNCHLVTAWNHHSNDGLLVPRRGPHYGCQGTARGPDSVSVWPSRHDCLVQRLKYNIVVVFVMVISLQWIKINGKKKRLKLSAFLVGKDPLTVKPESQWILDRV